MAQFEHRVTTYRIDAFSSTDCGKTSDMVKRYPDYFVQNRI